MAACTTTQNGTATPSQTDSVTPSTSDPDSQLPGAGVPGVAIPIDTTQFQQKPCTTLTDAQIAELLGPNVEPKEEQTGEAGPSCFWHPKSVTQAAVSVIYATKNRRGLTSIYQQQGTTFPLFIPMDPIDGYPTVAYGQADLRSKGNCAIALGTSNQDIVDVSVGLSEGNIGKKDPCAAAHEVAATVLNNFRAR
ncbi:DUF3558 domain-containing protein [Amycolatopsis mongoliensis]|uniref:DUF3558 domain-containing protein n=1 Tax=Amycolatopsis mongoliensis TaxID=715475 RepID=A0A9Y2K116_9PSEU|nr:DUF3558 domain-containing protein [Amycolatopsis sp. 4-36]WIY07296.1 DUF3558 domain-containing protein [Amycolatopsis sp. 4-36]